VPEEAIFRIKIEDDPRQQQQAQQQAAGPWSHLPAMLAAIKAAQMMQPQQLAGGYGMLPPGHSMPQQAAQAEAAAKSAKAAQVATYSMAPPPKPAERPRPAGPIGHDLVQYGPGVEPPPVRGPSAAKMGPPAGGPAGPATVKWHAGMEPPPVRAVPADGGEEEKPERPSKWMAAAGAAKTGMNLAGDIGAAAYSNVQGGGLGVAAVKGMEMLGAKIPAVGVALEVFGVAVEAATKVEKARAAAITHTSNMMQAAANNDIAAMRQMQISKTIQDNEASYGVFGKFSNWMQGLYTKEASVKAVKAGEDSALSTASRLSAYSPEIAGAMARAEAARVMADMRSAEKHGKSLAGIIENRAGLETAMSAAMAPGMEAMYKEIERLGGPGGDMAKMTEMMEKLGNQGEVMKFIAANGELSAKYQKIMAEELKRAREDREGSAFGNRMFKQLLDGANLLAGAPAAHDPIGDAQQDSMLRPLE